MKDKLSGTVIEGRYRLDEKLGEGAMGAVYEGWQLAVDRKVAIKLLHPFLSRRKDFKERFELEAKAVARLSNPHCLTLFDFGYDEELDLFYMVVEFIEGEVLADRMGEPIPLEEALLVTYQIAEALEHAHSQGILHRDLKPENIMVTTSTARPQAKVLDFGLARLFQEDEEEDLESTTKRRKRLTKAGEIYGTPAYMSPEQCKGSRDLSPESDLYSLGVMLYEMLDGRLPFHSTSPTELMLKQLNDPVPAMQGVIPSDVARLVEWLLKKSPEERPKSASAITDLLRSRVSTDVSQELRLMPEAARALGRAPQPVVQERPTLVATEVEAPPTQDDKEKKRANIYLVGFLVLLVGVVIGAKVVSGVSDPPSSAVTGSTTNSPPSGLEKSAVAAPIAIDPEVVGESKSKEVDVVAPEEVVEVAPVAEEVAEKPGAEAEVAESPEPVAKQQPKKRKKKSTKRKKTKTKTKPKTLKLLY